MSIIKLYFSLVFNRLFIKNDFSDIKKFYKFSFSMNQHKEELDHDKQLFLTKKLFPKLIYIPIFNFIYLLIYKKSIYTSFKSTYSKFWFWRVWSGLVFVNCLIVGALVTSIVFLWIGITNFQDKNDIFFILPPIMILFACFFSFVFPWMLRLNYINTSVFDSFIINYIYFPMINILINPKNAYLRNIDENSNIITIADKEFDDILDLIDWIFKLNKDEFMNVFNNKVLEE